MAGMGGANIAGAAIGGVSALMKLGLGIKQIIDGKKIQKRLDAQGRPIETTPEAFKETEGLVRSNYLDPRFMGEDEMRQAIEARGANQIQNIQQTAGSGADALMAYNVANNNSNKQLVDLGFKAADQQQQDYQQLLATLGQKAGYQQSQFQNNVMTPYMQQAQQAQALKQSGMTNMGNAFNDGGNTALGVSQMQGEGKKDDAQMAMLQSLLGRLGGNTRASSSTNTAGGGTTKLPLDLLNSIIGQFGKKQLPQNSALGYNWTM